ncbi:hypothetical protein HK102_001966 [Quaeritorhiza haematococci]|nr:hypothetical protein HK102_001966 [Quaeritorhiza haematococci]
MPPTNSYRGYSPAHKSETLDRIDPNFINQETFHAEYVAKRKPVIFTSILLGAKSQDRSPSAQSTAFRKWTDLEYLRTRAGSTIVKVEKKGPNGLFGSGQKRESMRFDELLDKLLDGSGNYYKTTQYEEDSPNSDSDHRLFLDFCQPPLTSLLGDFPLIPDLFESLIPQQVNLWLGSSAAASGQVTGASSGLHHDFADNLYVLLKGSKRFTIFSPKDSNFLYTYGKLSHVHPNGLQCYGSGNTRDPASLPRSDGAYPADVAKWRLEVAEENLRQAEESGDAEAIEHAEQEVDEAMDYMLQFDEEGEDDLDMFGGKVSKKKKKSAGDTSEQQQKPSEPPSFSRIDPDSLQAFVSSTSANDTASTTKKFPLVQKAIPISFVLHEGEMLYLPAAVTDPCRANGLSTIFASCISLQVGFTR